jgi:hypothetical protein
VWFDADLEGGQVWWDTILEQIRGCDLFVFVLSPDSIRSRPCQQELKYAVATGRPIVPVRVRDVDEQLAPPPVPTTQIVDYRQRTSKSAIQLTLAVARAATPVALPDPLPPPPAPPVADVEPLRERIAAPSLDFDGQRDLLDELRRRVEDRRDETVVAALLRELRARPDIAESVGHELDVLISRTAVSRPVEDAGAAPAPAAPARPIGLDPELVDLLRSLVTHIRSQHFTPILGPGLTDSLMGARQELARQWAQTFEYPMARHEQEDLPNVAQFVAVMTDTPTLRTNLGEYVTQQLHHRYPGIGPVSTERPLRDSVLKAWEQHRAATPAEPHTVLARLPCPIYVTAQPLELIGEALRREGKAPEVEVCRWRPDVYDWPASVFEQEPEFVPTAERPLVFHVFGHLGFEDSLVITEDDYLDFLARVAGDPTLIPLPVQRALADSALLFLGFGLQEWDVRVVLRALVSQEGARKLDKYTHVAAQIDLGDGVMSPARARRYLERYFGKYRTPSFDIFWGSVDELVAGLNQVWSSTK